MPTATIFCNRCGHSSSDEAQFCQSCGASLVIRSPSVLQPQSAVPQPHFGGFWIRVAAAVLDFLLLCAALFPARLLFGSLVTALGMSTSATLHQTLVARRIVRIVISALLVFAYRVGMESSTFQATVGKLVAGLKVTDLDGNRISFGRATGRYFAKWLSFITLGLGHVMAGFDEEKQGLHDRIAGTFVMYRRNTTRRVAAD